MRNPDVPEGWEEKKITEIAEIISGSTPSTSVKRYWDGSIVWITPDDLSNNEAVYLDSSARTLTDSGLKNCSARLIPKDSIVMSSRAPIGYLAIMKIDYATNQGCKSFRIRKDNPEYVYYSLSFNMPKIQQMGEGTTFSEISKSQLERVMLTLPKSVIEQGRIASVLLTIDNAIEKTKVRIAKYKNIRQGLMLNFFGDNPNWKKNFTNNELYMKGRIGWQGLKADEFMPYGDVYLITGIHFTIDNKVDWQRCYRISIKRYEQDPAIQVKMDDVIITKDGTIGKVAFIDQLPGKASLNSHLLLLRPKHKNIIPKYLFYQLLSSRFDKFIDNIKSGSTLVGLSQKNFGRYELLIPPMDEQVEIVCILDEMALKIRLEKAYLEKLKYLKAGLMRDLLSGEVRVKMAG